MRIAVIGAGISGLAFAKEILKKNNVKITIFEKSRGLGGRMATRSLAPYTFDHGAQHFTIRSDEFRNFLTPYFADGTVQVWKGNVANISPAQMILNSSFEEPHYVACPNMNSLAKRIAENLNVLRETEISSAVEQSNKTWRLFDVKGTDLGVFDWCVMSAPIAQTLRILPDLALSHPELLNVKMKSNFTLMAGLHEKQNFPWIAAKVVESPIGWISMNHRKPSRNQTAISLVIQSTCDWAEKNFEQEMQWVQKILLQEAQTLCQIKMSADDICNLQRWRYAIVSHPLKEPFVLNSEKKIAAIGDWCMDPRVESAWFSGYSLAKSI